MTSPAHFDMRAKQVSAAPADGPPPLLWPEGVATRLGISTETLHLLRNQMRRRPYVEINHAEVGIIGS
jgi:hypothetical protein